MLTTYILYLVVIMENIIYIDKVSYCLTMYIFAYYFQIWQIPLTLHMFIQICKYYLVESIDKSKFSKTTRTISSNAELELFDAMIKIDEHIQNYRVYEHTKFGIKDYILNRSLEHKKLFLNFKNKKIIEQVNEVVNKLDKIIYKNCEHEWKKDMSNYDEHASYVCEKCNLYRNQFMYN